MEEIWKDLIGFEEHYQVSNLGRIKSKDRILPRKNWTNKTYKSKILALHINENGYYIVRIGVVPNKKTCKLHRLIAKTWIANPHNKKYINHINGIKTDNRIENLEWCTFTENMRHAAKNNLLNPCRGEDSPQAKLTNAQVFDIKTRLKNGEKIHTLRKEYNVSKSIIFDIAHEVSWKSIIV